MTDNTKPTFMQQLEIFTSAIFELEDAWNREDHTGDLFSTGYPFTESLDEVVHKVMSWRDIQAQAEINQCTMKTILDTLESSTLGLQELEIIEESIFKLKKTAETSETSCLPKDSQVI